MVVVGVEVLDDEVGFLSFALKGDVEVVAFAFGDDVVGRVLDVFSKEFVVDVVFRLDDERGFVVCVQSVFLGL